ncbi:MAG: CarD family transcriptional regulator [Rhizobiales bacterium]|nr:CarD family transcriptional regulator [Hyphomicrobiales bacterium]
MAKNKSKAAKASKAPAKSAAAKTSPARKSSSAKKTVKPARKASVARKPAKPERKRAAAAKVATVKKTAPAAPKPAASKATAARKPVAPARPHASAAPLKPVHAAKPAASKLAAEVKPAAAVAPVRPAAERPAVVAAKPVPPKAQPVPPAAPTAHNGVPQSMTVKKPAPRSEFKAGEHIVYPAHGVGRIVGIETQEVAGYSLDLFVVSFIKDKMTLRVPVPKATSVGMRKLADNATVKKALETVRGRARIKRTMWSRRAQEYEAKINSGDLIAIAEVVRDLYRSENQPEQSYSERQLYEAALDRMSREISSVNRISETEAIRQIEQNLAKSPRRGAKPESGETPQEQAA